METDNHLWAIVLAGGEGTRLRSLTTDDRGVAIPKQFCSFRGLDDGRISFLRSTLNRAEGLVPKRRIVTVVAEQHRSLWKPELADYPPENVVVQPANRGTAAGVLLPLIEIHRRDRHAKVLVFPSDHYVENEDVLREALSNAVPMTKEHGDKILLLGMKPVSPDSEYGWIVPFSGGGLRRSPEPPGGGIGRAKPDPIPFAEHGMLAVASFIEKPPVDIAEKLMKRGAFWNTFMLITLSGTLLRLYATAAPELLEPFLKNPTDLDSVYKILPTLDFSRHVLGKSVSRLWVLPLPECGWSDLGTPKRIVSVLHRHTHFPVRRGERMLNLPRVV